MVHTKSAASFFWFSEIRTNTKMRKQKKKGSAYVDERKEKEITLELEKSR